MSQSVLVDVGPNGVARVTLNRPEKRNAFDDVMISRLTEVFNDLGARDDVRVLLLKGAGKAFCGGGDINWMKRMATFGHEENLADARHLAGMMTALDLCPKPTIALVHGAAYGGGVGLISACDIVLATRQASFCLSEVKIGLIPAVISPFVLRAMGARAARRYFLTAEVLDSDAALQNGLVHDIFGDDIEMATAADRLIADLSKNAPGALGETKDLIRTLYGTPVDEVAMEEVARRIANRRASPEGQEGLKAFLEKRKAAWIAQD